MSATIPDEFLDVMADKFRMLADPTRLAILRALMGGAKNVTQVVAETGRNQANVSKHLKMLAESGLIARRKQGLRVFYSLDDPLVERLCRIVCDTIIDEAREPSHPTDEAPRWLGSDGIHRWSWTPRIWCGMSEPSEGRNARTWGPTIVRGSGSLEGCPPTDKIG